jgi:hypothetical protein
MFWAGFTLIPRLVGWALRTAFGPLDTAIQNAVNAAVWWMEAQGVRRIAIYYAHDAAVASTGLALNAAQGHWLMGIGLTAFLVAAMHVPTARRDWGPAGEAAAMLKAFIVWGALTSAIVVYETGERWTRIESLRMYFFALLLLTQYLRRVPRQPPPRRRRELAPAPVRSHG